MPAMGWQAFKESHHKPFLIFADLVPGRSEQIPFELVRRLAINLGLRGNFAVFPDDGFVRVALELESDAERFAQAVQAKRTAREADGSDQWAFRLDATMKQHIDTLLEPAQPASPRAPRGKPKKRTSPF